MLKTLFVIICLLFVSTANASTVIEARILRNQAGSGSCLISSGFPLPPGVVTEQLIRDGKIRVMIRDTEVSANVSALRGRHADGTLRSMLIQFSYALAQGDDLPAQVIIDDGVRKFADPPYQRPTLEIVANNNVILPSDRNYLVKTRISLRGLLPEGMGTFDEECIYTEMAEDRFKALSVSQQAGTASYEHVSAIISLWARSGDAQYYKEAVKQGLLWLPYNTPAADQSPPCRSDGIMNPDARSGGQTCGVPSEWYFPRVLSYAQMYLLTGYRDFWGIVAFSAQYQQWDITDRATAIAKIIRLQEWDTPRFNYSYRYGALLAALMIDATIPVHGAYSTGRVFDWPKQLVWTIDALEHHRWNFKWIPFTSGRGVVPPPGTVLRQERVTATLLGVYQKMHDPMHFPGMVMPASGYLMVAEISGGTFKAGALTNIFAVASGSEINDYRNGLVGGIRSNSPRGLSRPPNNPAKLPVFQLIFPTNFLIDTYLYFYRDVRIPDMVKTNLDIILQNIRPKLPGDPYYAVKGGVWGDHQYVSPYALENPPKLAPAGFPDATIPFELPEYARIVAFVLKTKGESTVNGATYSEWYERFANAANVSPLLLSWQWKYFGQFYSWGIDAPWMMAQPSLTDVGPVALRIPQQYFTIPGDQPDIGRVYTERATTVPVSQ